MLDLRGALSRAPKGPYLVAVMPRLPRIATNLGALPIRVSGDVDDVPRGQAVDSKLELLMGVLLDEPELRLRWDIWLRHHRYVD